MRLARFGEPGAERPAASLDERTWHDVSGVVPDIDGRCSRAGSPRLPSPFVPVGAASG